MKVYQHDGIQYQQIEELTVGLEVRALAINSETLIVSGKASELCIYHRNGIGYALHQNITTIEPFLPDLYVSADFSQISFGGSSKSVSTYQELSGTYSLMHNNLVNKGVMEVFSDERELYVMVETGNEMLTYYKCPNECTACLFPNNCTSCIPNYILQNGVCSKASHCVKNILIKKNVCRDYCSRQCRTCNQTKDDCVDCAKFY